jgi:hypothetical protein
MGARIITTRDNAPQVNRIIRADGGVCLIEPFFMADESPDYVTLLFTKEHVLDTSIAFYVRVGENITTGVLCEALGPDHIVESLL